MNSPEDRLPPDQHAQILKHRVLSHPSFDRMTTQEQPRAIILSGQPGAGKGGLERLAQVELNNDAVTVDPGRLRDRHPEIEIFRHESPYNWSGRTHPDASQWADELLEATVSGRKNLIFDTTLSNGQWASDTLILNLQAQGYDVEVRVMASHRLESEHGVYERFAGSLDRNGYGRHVPKGARDAIYGKLPASLDIIRERTDVPIRLFNREREAIYDSRNNARPPSVAQQHEPLPSVAR